MGFSAVLVFLLVACPIKGYVRWPLREFRGVWVATVGNIDWPSSRNLTTSQQKEELIQILDKLVELNFNAVIFHIRPTSDAFYNSSFEPWSMYLTGTQGDPPSPYYDPLEFAVSEAHSRNLEIHAWLNPYRVKSNGNDTSGLASNNIAKQYPQYAYPYGNSLIMDPGASEIQQRIHDVLKDIVTKYDVDGIHLDDYFYPYPVENLTFPDNVTYNNYVNKHQGKHPLSLADWRRNNVNTLILEISKSIKRLKPYVKFGISPFGIWKNGQPQGVSGMSAYFELYADSRKWIRKGYVDYLAPQLYWPIHSDQSFSKLLRWWVRQNIRRHHIYPGIYTGRLVVNDWPLEEIENQVKESRKRLKSSFGNIQFSMKYFLSNTKGVDTMFRTELYTSPALLPEMRWLPKIEPPKPLGISVANGTVSWTVDESQLIRSWAVYKVIAKSGELIAVLNNSVTDIHLDDGVYAIRSVSRLGNESPPSYVKIKDKSAVPYRPFNFFQIENNCLDSFKH